MSTTMSTTSTGQVFLRTCAAEWTRLWSVRSTWWFLLAATVVMLGLGTLLGFESAADPSEVQGEPAWLTAQYIVMPAQFALLALVLMAVTADYATGGIVPALQWTPRRTTLVVARVLVTVAVATAIGLVLAVGAALLAHTTASGALTLRAEDGLDMVGTVAFVLATGTLMAAGLGFLLRNTAAVLIAAFLLMLVLPALLPNFGDWLAEVAQRLPGSGALHLLFGDLPGMTTTSAIVVLLAWSLGAVVLGWLRMVRDDATR